MQQKIPFTNSDTRVLFSISTDSFNLETSIRLVQLDETSTFSTSGLAVTGVEIVVVSIAGVEIVAVSGVEIVAVSEVEIVAVSGVETPQPTGKP